MCLPCFEQQPDFSNSQLPVGKICRSTKQMRAGAAASGIQIPKQTNNKAANHLRIYAKG